MTNVNPLPICIENSQCRAIIQPFGAELVEFSNKKTGVNYLWNGNGWPNTAPVLFPIVGNLPNESYLYQGKTYHLPRHGFARSSLFKVVQQTSDQVILELRDNQRTQAIYPFSFELTIDFKLENNSLKINYQVTNHGESPLLFSLGSHPAFKHSQQAKLVFESLPCAYLGDHGFIDFNHPTALGIDGNTIDLAQYDFSQGPLYFQNVPSQNVRLENQDVNETKSNLTMQISSSPYLGIWKKPGCDFICIEPWHGITAKDPHQIESLENKRGIISLDANQTFSTDYGLFASS